MNEENAQFNDILSQCAEEAEALELNDNFWAPPNGEYNVRLQGVSSGMKSPDDGRAYAWVRPEFVILDGSEAGKTFSCYYRLFAKPDMSKFTEKAGMLRLAELATCIVGRETKNPSNNLAIVQNAADSHTLLRVGVDRGKDPRFPNYYWRETIVDNGGDVPGTIL